MVSSHLIPWTVCWETQRDNFYNALSLPMKLVGYGRTFLIFDLATVRLGLMKEGTEMNSSCLLICLISFRFFLSSLYDRFSLESFSVARMTQENGRNFLKRAVSKNLNKG